MDNQCSRHSEPGGCNSYKSKGSCECNACGTTNESCCPVEKSMEMWACAGNKAWKEIHVDLLKTKIMKAWGPQMEKTADAVVEAMGIEWQAMLAQGKAKADLQEKIAKIFAEGKK